MGLGWFFEPMVSSNPARCYSQYGAIRGTSTILSMKTQASNDSRLPQSAMLSKEDVRCSCWSDKPEKEQRWRAEVMADGAGYCKHCREKMTFYYPIKP